MTAARNEILTLLWEAGSGKEVVWVKDGRRGERCPHPGALKALVKDGLVEAETRSCSAWTDDTRPNSREFYVSGRFDSVRFRQAMNDWESQRIYRTRVTIAARLLPKGIWHCCNVLALN